MAKDKKEAAKKEAPVVVEKEVDPSSDFVEDMTPTGVLVRRYKDGRVVPVQQVKTMAAKKATKKKAEPSVPMITVRRFNKELQKRELMTIKKADIIPTGYYADVVCDEDGAPL